MNVFLCVNGKWKHAENVENKIPNFIFLNNPKMVLKKLEADCKLLSKSLLYPPPAFNGPFLDYSEKIEFW